MHDLDNASFVLELDPKGMHQYAVNFPKQVQDAVLISSRLDLSSLTEKPKNVVLAGMGGSAAGGDFTKCLFESGGDVPFIVCRDYELPGFVNSETLVIACSYSGNTEETLSAYHEAKEQGAMRIVVTSGGKLAELAKQDGVPLCIVPGGQPPRASLGYLLMPLIVACEKLGLIPNQDYEGLIATLMSCVDLWSVEVSIESNHPKQLAQAMQGKIGILYGLGSWQGIVANRWKGQINENAKNMAFAQSFPELNHNEILGWVKSDLQASNWITVVLQDGHESAKMKARAKVTAELTSKLSLTIPVRAIGQTLLEKMLTLALFGDFVSIYLAALNRVDPENIDWINVLKSELSKID